MKKFILLISTFLLCLSLVACGGNNGVIKADHWYHYKDLDIVNMQNCLVADAFVKVAGNVAVSYYPVCKECHEPSQSLSMGVADEDNPIMKSYYCDCGGCTTVIIKIIV